MDFKLTRKEKILALTFAVMGFVFTTRSFLMWLNQFNPVTGLFVYYVILYVSLFALSKFGLVIFNIQIKKPLQVFGMILVLAGFFCVTNWESSYINYAVTGKMPDVTQIYFQTEDGALFYLWGALMPAADIEVLRLLTYVLSPALLALIGGLLIKEKIKVS